ncbi:MAG: hypothetical protein PHP37_01145 [Patescibacteria group bacterium]|nr:hypothetical protein [Patescibacteria group bacterium]
MSLNNFSKYLKTNFLTIFLLFLSLIINIGSVFYYFYKFNDLVLVIIFFLALFLTYIFVYFSIYRSNQQALPISQGRQSGDEVRGGGIILKIILPLITLSLFFILFQILFKFGSFSAIASPWHFLPTYFWIFLWFLLLTLFVNFYFKNRWSYLFLLLFYFLFFSISFFVYKIAFGYDQLLHQRAISDILKFGLIEPKTIYYIGQYTLELFVLKIWPFSPEILDKMLVPILSVILIPVTFIHNFKRRGFDKTIWPLVIFLVLPFSIFTYTVPQNLSFLFLIILLLFSFNKYFVKNRFNFFFLFSLSLAIFFIHPLAGVPAIIFTFILFTSFHNPLSFSHPLSFPRKRESSSYYLKIIAYLGQIIILPTLLILSGGRFASFSMDFSNWIPRLLGQENIFLNFIYLFGLNKNICLLILFILATVFVFKFKRRDLKIFYFNSTALMLSYFISIFIDFPFLSQIDKNSYANRIFILSFLFLIPIFYEMFICLMKKISQEKKPFKIIVIIFLSLLLLTSLYLNYPRKDNYFNSRSYSVSSADFMAVGFIDSVKENDNYIVLANQQVGASAIKEYGFKRYYGPWLYYSVQTGGLLYDYYLKMIEAPDRELMLDLMSEIGAEGVYFVVNDYWWAFDRIIEEARVEANMVYSVADGRIMVFYFKP